MPEQCYVVDNNNKKTNIFISNRAELCIQVTVDNRQLL